MEFPDLGKNCSDSSCKKLDFLPMKCDACSKIFCGDHIQYSSHKCTESYKRDNQVPVCPLCNTPIPVKAGELPDVRVGQHIDSDCQSDPAKERRKIYTNKCSHKRCKQKELMPVTCDKCRQNFCLKHRHEQDHDCQGFQGSCRAMTSAGAAALFRSLPKKNTSTNNGASTSRTESKPQASLLSSIGLALHRARQERQNGPRPAGQNAQALQNGMSEDEAMARALQLSMAESSNQRQTSQPNRPMSLQEQEDFQIAQALAASEQEVRNARNRRQQAQQEKWNCHVS